MAQTPILMDIRVAQLESEAFEVCNLEEEDSEEMVKDKVEESVDASDTVHLAVLPRHLRMEDAD